MKLTYEKLIEFDLLKDAEKNLVGNHDKLIRFLNINGEITRADMFIRQLPSYPGSTTKIVIREMVSAIGSTLAIEGIHINDDEIEESFRKADKHIRLASKEQEADNSRKVYQFIREVVKDAGDDFVYKEGMVKQIHNLFTSNMNYLGNVPGQYRNSTVQFGYPLKTGLCLSELQVRESMEQFIGWLNSDDSSLLGGNKLIKAIMAHYYLTEIHPFNDGNGRAARAVEALVLYQNKTNEYCFWSLANFWSSQRNEYINNLRKIGETSCPLDFILWGLEGYLEEVNKISAKVLLKVKQLMLGNYAEYLLKIKKERPVKERVNERITRVIKVLTKTGGMTINEFWAHPTINALYSGSNSKPVSVSTKRRDILVMLRLNLIELPEEGEVAKIIPNYKVLDSVTYSV